MIFDFPLLSFCLALNSLSYETKYKDILKSRIFSYSVPRIWKNKCFQKIDRNYLKLYRFVLSLNGGKVVWILNY